MQHVRKLDVRYVSGVNMDRLGEGNADLLFREKLPTAQGTSFPRPNQFHAHGYVNEINDAVDCVLEAERAPQSGPMLAWARSTGAILPRCRFLRAFGSSARRA